MVRTSQGTATQAQEPLLRDFLIAAIGDSIASGEGNPEVPCQSACGVAGIGQPAVWQNANCHRSSIGWTAQTAVLLEASDPHSSVTLIDVACSGAGILKGLIGSFKGNRPQIATVAGIHGQRPLDAIFMTVGADDIGFAGIAKKCLFYPCLNKFLSLPPLHEKNPGYVIDDFNAAIAQLPSRFTRLKPCLNGVGADYCPTPLSVNEQRVFISQYHDPTRDVGNLQPACDYNYLGAFGTGHYSPDEMDWAEQTVVAHLNATVAAAAHDADWTYIDGIANDFSHGHGICAPNGPEGHWVVQMDETLGNQGDPEGLLHPNAVGHLDFVNHAFPLVQQFLLQNP